MVSDRVRSLLLQIFFGLISPLVSGRLRLSDTASSKVFPYGANVGSDDTGARQGSDQSDGNGLRKKGEGEYDGRVRCLAPNSGIHTHRYT